MTVLEAIQKTGEFLGRRGVDSPRLQAELLLAQALHLPRMKLYLNFDRELTPVEVDTFREFTRRRGQREPLQHIVGTVSFCGLELGSTRHALVPRSETELLAQMAWEYLSQHRSATPTCFDFGTGTACLPIAIAANCPRARLWAGDISPDALALARGNIARHGMTERVQLVESDGFVGVPSGQHFDLVVSNPPYIPTAEINTLQVEVRDHDPRGALDGGEDGLTFYLRLAKEAASYLNPDGRIMVELGDGQAAAVRAIFAGENWIVEAVRQDYSQRDRFLIARCP